jgi:(2S)-methylsuccinyl-CoA dehydrogenase
MNAPDSLPQATRGLLIDSLDTHCASALKATERLLDGLRDQLRAQLANAGRDAHNVEQARTHGYAWAGTYLRALHEMLDWGKRLAARGARGEFESLIQQAAFGEYLAQLAGGLPMSQGEIFRAELIDEAGTLVAAFRADPAVRLLSVQGFAPPVRARLAELMAAGRATRDFGDPGFEDSALTEIRTQFGRWSDDHADAAHGWHLRNELIPDSIITELGELGVFGLTVPESWGGSGLSKTAMCVVTEELSRGWIGLGSLGTRTEIACELILLNGTEEQKQRLLPGIVTGKIIPTASFTEPDTGSDLASLRTRAESGQGADGQSVWRIHGNKTWTTHGARSDLMTLLARSEKDLPGYRGLSMFLVPKPRGTDANPFPAPGMSGGEIEVLGYRGMKEYEIGFDGYEIPGTALLGGEPGNGFKQLMRTFESARIQTAARAVGVAQSAMELGLAYACDRQQFGRAILGFPRVADKLAWMAVEIMIARQLTLFAARQKDADRRCDVEAGMAKLLAARVAWGCADNAAQVHGGNGYAMEYRISRVLVDARILNVFEGAGEIQAGIVAKALLD